MKLFVRISLASLLLVGSLGAETNPWSQLKTGMSADAAFALLGEPMLRSRGGGFETWIYERGGEAVVRSNALLGWTAPADLVKAATPALVSTTPATRPSAAVLPVPAPTPAPATTVVAAKPVILPVTVAEPQKTSPSTKEEVLALLGAKIDNAARPL